MRILLESSKVPIYERINHALKIALEDIGHEVIFFMADFPDDKTYIETLNGISADFYLLSNEGARAQKFSDKYNKYLFELLKHKLVFLCHDNIYCGTGSIEKLEKRYLALRNVSENSRIFCIEKSNVQDLSLFGVRNIFHINHATEFKYDDSASTNEPISFVGHTMAGLNTFPVELFSEAPYLLKIARRRLEDCTFSVQKAVDDLLLENNLSCDFITRQNWLNILNKMTFAYRGDLLNQIDEKLDIYGGDLSYGQGDKNIYIIPSEKIKYKPATQDYYKTASIYKNSKISINISGFQFDTAVTNRVLDVIAAGGILLTDFKSDFISNFPYAEELTYKNANELKEKIEKSKDPNYLRRLERICDQIRIEIEKKFSYKNTVEIIINSF
jgi:hypothetical protein